MKLSLGRPAGDKTVREALVPACLGRRGEFLVRSGQDIAAGHFPVTWVLPWVCSEPQGCGLLYSPRSCGSVSTEFLTQPHEAAAVIIHVLWFRRLTCREVLQLADVMWQSWGAEAEPGPPPLSEPPKCHLPPWPNPCQGGVSRSQGVAQFRPCSSNPARAHCSGVRRRQKKGGLNKLRGLRRLPVYRAEPPPPPRAVGLQPSGGFDASVS